MNIEKRDTDKEMNFEEFFGHYVQKYLSQYYMFFPGRGYIVWRFGTGENVELLHIRSFKTGQGLGPRLVKVMLRELKKNPPFYSIFGMMLAANEPVIKMYQKMGFNTMECPFPYKGGNSVMMYQSAPSPTSKRMAIGGTFSLKEMGGISKHKPRILRGFLSVTHHH